jgi:hypothetical protein
MCRRRVIRYYQPIWNQIKREKKASLIAPAYDHPKIIQAVMKERSADIAFRNLLKKNNIKMELFKSSIPEKNLLEFELKDVTSVKIGDL